MLKEFTGPNTLNVPRLPISSCIFLTCDLTLTVAHMVQYICHHHLIPVGGGKTASEDEKLSVYDYYLPVYSFNHDNNEVFAQPALITLSCTITQDF